MTMMIQSSSSPTNDVVEASEPPPSSSTTSSDKALLPEDFQPGPDDVICGRGKVCFNHQGNVQFRALIEETSEQYAAAEDDKLEKIQIVTLVLNRVQNKGQFVRKDPFSERWYPVADSISREKISSAFRDCLHEKYRSSAMSKKRRREERIQKATTAAAAATVATVIANNNNSNSSNNSNGSSPKRTRVSTDFAALDEAVLQQQQHHQQHRQQLQTRLAEDRVLAKWAASQKPAKTISLPTPPEPKEEGDSDKEKTLTRKIMNKDSPLFDKDFVPSDTDVLCGRGPLIANHPGNVKFHSWVKELLPSYFKAAIMEKQDFVHQVLDQVWRSGGRFLKEDSESGRWYQVNDPAAKAKTSQAFRDGLGATKNKLRREEERSKDVQRINFEVKAHQGDADAQYQLALCHLKGSQGAERSPQRAVEWLEIAAKNGHADAQYELGKAYHEGVGVQQDMGVAVEWFCKAASQFYQITHQDRLQKTVEASKQGQNSAFVAVKASAPAATTAETKTPSPSDFTPVPSVEKALGASVLASSVAAAAPAAPQPLLAFSAHPQLPTLGPLQQRISVQLPEPRLTVQEWLALSRQVNLGGHPAGQP